MSWITITDDDLEDTKLAPLLSALRSTALADGQDDPVAELLATVVSRVRLEIAAGDHDVDADTTKVPPSLKRLVTRMVLWDAKSRLEIDTTEQERIDHANDLAFLRRIAADEIEVESPDNPVVEGVDRPHAEIVTQRTRRATRADLDGLL